MDADDLRAGVAAAEVATLNSPGGALSRIDRISVWEALGNPIASDGAGAFTSKGHELRARLALRVAERHLKYWETALPEDVHPHRMLLAGFEFVAGNRPRSELRRMNDDFWNYLLDERSSVALPVGAAAYAVRAAIATVLGDEDLESGQTDDERDPEVWDAAFLASVSVSGETPWRGGDAQRRREYWLWYLREARRVALDFGLVSHASEPIDALVGGALASRELVPLVRRRAPDGSSGPKLLQVSEIRRAGSRVLVRLSMRDPAVCPHELARIIRIKVLSEVLEGLHDSADTLVVEGLIETPTLL